MEFFDVPHGPGWQDLHSQAVLTGPQGLLKSFQSKVIMIQPWFPKNQGSGKQDGLDLKSLFIQKVEMNAIIVKACH